MEVNVIQLEWGLLWFDDTKGRTLAQKIRIASARYETKYGVKPSLCVVNPATKSGDDSDNVDGIQVEVSRSVMPNHLWMGVATDKTARKASSSRFPETVERTITDVNQASSDTCGQAE
jgi:hypothetical protein